MPFILLAVQIGKNDRIVMNRMIPKNKIKYNLFFFGWDIVSLVKFVIIFSMAKYIITKPTTTSHQPLLRSAVADLFYFVAMPSL